MKKETNTLIATLNKDVTSYLKSYKESKASREEGRVLATQLPEFITTIHCWVFRKRGEKEWYLETGFLDAGKADNLVRELKIWGAHRMKSHYSRFGTNSHNWSFDCCVLVGDVEIVIKVDGGSQPLNCTIREVKEMKEVVTYEAICEETGESV